MKVYISGPMTGLPAYNYPAFELAAAALTVAGHEPVSPAGELNPCWGYPDYLRRALKLLLESDAILMLDGWENSIGATLENRISVLLQMPRIEL